MTQSMARWLDGQREGAKEVSRGWSDDCRGQACTGKLKRISSKSTSWRRRWRSPVGARARHRKLGSHPKLVNLELGAITRSGARADQTAGDLAR